MDHATAGRIGAHVSWARTDDRPARTRRAREKFLERFEHEVDPNRVLPLEERRVRAESAKRAYFTALATRPRKAS